MPIKAYPLAWARHDAVRATAARWLRQGLVTPAQQAAINAAYPADYYQPNIFLRIGLFIFTWLGGAALAGFIGMVTGFESPTLIEVVSCIGAVVVLEVAINRFRHYHSGLDTVALYAALLLAVSLLVDLYDRQQHYLAFDDFLLGSGFGSVSLLLLVLALLVAATLRYADRLVAAVAYLVYLLLVVNITLYLPFGLLVLPFALMLASAAAYWLSARVRQREDYPYYEKVLDVVRLLALLTFYLGGNYLVVREGNAALSGQSVSAQVPLAPLFYLFTVTTPLAYIYFGLRRANRQMLLVGLGVVCFSIYTYRFYHSILPPEIAAVIAGILLIGLSAWALHYLRTARHGLTAVAETDEPHFNLESLIVAETAEAPGPPTGFAFGGGSSGGGGTTGSF